MKILNYKNIRLPQRESDNHSNLVLDSNSVLNNFITNIDWVINYFNYGSDYMNFNLMLNRYDINKLSLLQSIFNKRFDKSSIEYKKLFNFSYNKK